MKTDGEVALVTGAGQAIGRDKAPRLATADAHVAVVDINEAKVIAVAYVGDMVRR